MMVTALQATAVFQTLPAPSEPSAWTHWPVVAHQIANSVPGGFASPGPIATFNVVDVAPVKVGVAARVQVVIVAVLGLLPPTVENAETWKAYCVLAVSPVAVHWVASAAVVAQGTLGAVGTVVVATHGGDAEPHAQRLTQMNQGRAEAHEGT